MSVSNGVPGHAGTAPAAVDTQVAIVGAGFGGVAAAIRLIRDGERDFVVFERASDVGGVWRANTYPGCQCDVPSHLYSFSFAPNPGWSQTYSPQPEIWEYLRRVARDHGVLEHVRFDTEVRRLSWLEDRQCWHVETSAGDLTARVVVAAPGGLSQPQLPDIPGLEAFEGTTFHSATWNHEHDLAGERVAVIGTGASAIQFVPRIQPKVARLDVYQRTPPWIAPHTNRPVTALERRLFTRFPAFQLLARGVVYGSREALLPGFRGNPVVRRVMEGVARRHLRAQVRDPELRRKLTPRYRMGCKRILVSNDFYPALAQPNVELVTDGIREIRPRSVVDGAGIERETDTIIFGTGFQVSNFPAGQYIHGREGVRLTDVWRTSAEAHRGTTIAGFPNLFVLTGPNTGLGHNSVVYVIESQLNYLSAALRRMRRHGAAALEVKAEAQRSWNHHVQRRLQGTVWMTGGCSSWYLDAQGRNVTLWPDHTWKLRQALRRFDVENYELEPPRTPSRTGGAPAGAAA